MSETTTAAEHSEQPVERPASPLRRALVWAAVIGVAAAGTTGLAIADLTEAPVLGGAAARFVPDDGVAQLLREGDGTLSVRESARDIGPALLLELPSIAANDVFSRVDTDEVLGAQFWRETVTEVGGESSQTSSLYRLDGSGLSLLTATGGSTGFSFDPALPMLPADVRPGSRWSAEGAALPFGLMEYELTSEARDGGDGCLVVDSHMAYIDPEADAVMVEVDESATWCPGLGIVADTATIAGERIEYTSERLERDAPTPAGLWTGVDAPALDWSAADRWSATTLPFRIVDAGFGESEVGIPNDGLATSLGDDGLVLSAGSRLVGYRVDGATATRAWLAAPGGTIAQLTAVDGIALVATTQRELVAYAPTGIRLWARSFPDLVVAAPVSDGAGGVVVASVDGTVMDLDLASGAERWSRTLRTDVGVAPVVEGDRVAVLDRGGVVRGLRLSDGGPVWEQEFFGADRLASGGAVVVQSGGAELWVLDSADGSVRWEADQRGIARDVVTIAGVVVGLSDELVTAYDLADGTERWTAPRVEQVLSDGERVLLAGESELTVRDARGTELGRLDIGPADLGVNRRFVPAGDRVWVVTTATTGMVIAP